MDILSTVLTAGVTSGVVTAVINWFLKARERDEQRRWELKREACLDALKIVDSRFADYDWKNNTGASLKIDKQGHISTGEIRSCFNRLILACEDREVPTSFEKWLNLDIGQNTSGSPLNMRAVTELRNAIRKELGFGKELVTNVNWISFINWKDESRKPGA
jgi:hypothetical protein